MDVTNIDERGTFKGDDVQLCNCISALIELNDKGWTAPRVPEMAVSLLMVAKGRLTTAQSEAAELRAEVELRGELLRECLRWLPQMAGHQSGSTTDLLCDRISAALTSGPTT